MVAYPDDWTFPGKKLEVNLENSSKTTLKKLNLPCIFIIYIFKHANFNVVIWLVTCV